MKVTLSYLKEIGNTEIQHGQNIEGGSSHSAVIVSGEGRAMMLCAVCNP